MGLTHDGWDKKTGRPEFLSDGKDTLTDKFLGNSPTAKIWGELWCFRDLDFSLSDLARCADISRTSLYKVWPFFIESEIIIPSRIHQGVQLYKKNKHHLLAKKMMNLLSDYMKHETDKMMALEEFIDKQYKKAKDKRIIKKINKTFRPIAKRIVSQQKTI